MPLTPYGACNLGSINLTQFVCDPFTAQAHLDWEGTGTTASTAVRLLDNVIDISRFPLAKQAEQARNSRRVGLGMIGLADALIMLQSAMVAVMPCKSRNKSCSVFAMRLTRLQLRLPGKKDRFRTSTKKSILPALLFELCRNRSAAALRSMVSVTVISLPSSRRAASVSLPIIFRADWSRYLIVVIHGEY